MPTFIARNPDGNWRSFKGAMPNTARYWGVRLIKGEWHIVWRCEGKYYGVLHS